MSRPIVIPASRAAAAGRAAILLALSAVLLLPLSTTWPTLQFEYGPASDRAANFAIAWLIMLPGLLAIALAFRAASWLLFALWSGWLGFRGDARALHAGLGNFGSWSVSWSHLTVEWPDYLFTMDLDRDSPLPMRECPPIHCTRSKRRLDKQIRRFASTSEDTWWPTLEPHLRPLLFADPRWTTGE